MNAAAGVPVNSKTQTLWKRSDTLQHQKLSDLDSVKLQIQNERDSLDAEEDYYGRNYTQKTSMAR